MAGNQQKLPISTGSDARTKRDDVIPVVISTSKLMASSMTGVVVVVLTVSDHLTAKLMQKYPKIVIPCML